ncbi:cytochrome b-c1 complex subunit 10-like [Hippopotamus amphibius kiboko]|uniref:cytochrome b-c1 complex subunit 10-like n=1 Tax=Hippopotamus amphibius kiboko TaxID=575201 RepID=UPI0025991D29|nr:cytochrome b-c1 complex subunit 10-like [Hippopotamus amphibius kiboko]
MVPPKATLFGKTVTVADSTVTLSRFLGRGYRELARNWIPAVGVWGAVGTLGLLWATSWRLILDCVRYLNGKVKKVS